MSLGLPGKILEIRGNEATVDFWGTKKEVRLDLLEQHVLAGDYVLVHEGCAVRVIPTEEVLDTLGMYELVLCEA